MNLDKQSSVSYVFIFILKRVFCTVEFKEFIYVVATPHRIEGPRDLKQNDTQEKDPFSGPDFHIPFHMMCVIRFV